MDLALTQDHRAILEALDALARPYLSMPVGAHDFALTSDRLDRELREGGFLDVALDPDLGTIAAAIVIERLARLPFTSEVALTAMIGPMLGSDHSGPLCIVDGTGKRALRFLRAGSQVIVLDGKKARSFIATADQLRAEPEALFAYPMATLLVDPLAAATTEHSLSAQELRVRWQAAVAAEMAGLLGAALESVCAHVTDRQQFGRPIATFQAVRHRLADAQVRSNGVYWLAMRAAATLDPADTALALLHAQESARAVVYDFHQFLGAMGMTLEHPLHLWTYRLKALIGEAGGRGSQALAAADALWGS